MLERLMTPLRRLAGIRVVADLGEVYQGKLGQVDCEVRLWLEQWRGRYFVAIQVAHRRGSNFSRTRVLKWPYSKAQPQDLQAVIGDLQVVERAAQGQGLKEGRGWVGRAVDRVFRRDYLGEYRFASPLAGRPASRVEATVENASRQTWVSLVERRGRKGSIMVQFPHAAVRALREALETYATRG